MSSPLRFVISTAMILFGLSGAQAEGKHPLMHRALWELRECRVELKEAGHDFGGHREKALIAVNGAIKQIDLALKAVKDNPAAFKGHPAEIYKEYPNHPHVRHALHELHEAHKELKEAGHDFGGHREKALKDVNHAIEQLELALKFANGKK